MDLYEEEVLKMAISRYGETHQVIKATEELSELQKELCRWVEGVLSGAFVNNVEMRDRSLGLITAEMADVYVTMRQLEMIFHNKAAVQSIVANKIARLKYRMENGDKGAT